MEPGIAPDNFTLDNQLATDLGTKHLDIIFSNLIP